MDLLVEFSIKKYGNNSESLAKSEVNYIKGKCFILFFNYNLFF